MSKTKRKSTMIELVAELNSINLVNGADPRIDLIIEEAKAGEYHDYKNKKYVCGKVMLVEHLRQAGLWDLSKRVIDGEFDEEADEQDIEMMKRECPPEMWPILGLDK